MSENSREFDRKMMRLALQLARRGQGRVEPNPLVGAVLCRGRRIVGRGWHGEFGGPHAEINAIRMAGGKARGGTLYVTLEPCCHHGKTGPCTEAILAVAIQRVVVAMVDPNPLVCGQGIRRLRNSGVEVCTGVCQVEAQRLNRPFVKWITTGRPYVILKWAQTIDGCVESRGKSKWISSAASRSMVHQLRGRVDAVMVGIGTVRQDDPRLTARPKKAMDLRRIPRRVILDSYCRLPLTSRLARSARSIPVCVFHRRGFGRAAVLRRKRLESYGVQCLAVAPASEGGLNIREVLQRLGGMGCTNLLVEGGPKVLGAFFQARLADEAWVFIAPQLHGETRGRRAVEGIAPGAGAGIRGAGIEQVRRIAEDILVRLRLAAGGARPMDLKGNDIIDI